MGEKRPRGEQLDAALGALPARLARRVRQLKPARSDAPAAAGSGGGAPVVLWLRATLRAHENPALDVAAHAARALHVPLVVLLTPPPCSTSRRLAFALEGLADVAAELAARGVAVHAHVPRPGARQRRELTAAHRASLVVLDEDFNVEPLAGLSRALSAGGFAAAVLSVDAACVVPASLAPRSACNRAGAYASATAASRAHELREPYDDAGDLAGLRADDAAVRAVLPFEPADLSDVRKLLAECAPDVDASVAPVGHTPGGSAAGYRRWDAWVARGGLKRYAARRNDAADPHGASRMSAYLNLGMVSPWRLARDAKNAGARKFLDEMQTWREIAYAHCLRHPGTYCRVDGLPQWAQKTLRAHANDARDVKPLEDLAAGRSGSDVWDAAQRALVASGELHNNLRMTWGKAVVGWSATPDDACSRLVHLNDTYALDGCAPPSYGGLMWCLGLFDGPKREQAVIGTVRDRPLAAQRRRVDVARLNALTAMRVATRPAA